MIFWSLRTFGTILIFGTNFLKQKEISYEIIPQKIAEF